MSPRASQCAKGKQGMGESNSSVNFVVSLSIHDNGMANFERIVQQMIEGTRQEPGCTAYDWYMDKERRQCRLLEQYCDGAAVLAHLRGRVVQELVQKLMECCTITNFEVYGDPGEEATTILQSIPATIFSPWRMLRG